MLARTWFHCKPSEVLKRCNSLELSEMWAEYQIAPWCSESNDTRLATVGFALAKSQTENFSSDDFYPPWREQPEQTEEEMQRALLNAAGGFEE